MFQVSYLDRHDGLDTLTIRAGFILKLARKIVI